ncbi:hypothetical protein EV384_5498 [Micromonospora kangleipakensis]|uniref:Uncharacterized protein n=1 Tax=Micromonospora kangleipakensis TaxID=1077942 RepID=A0A4Q8BGC5_9ACTN|nr:hypothetical protein [Micromonospora kangleipakensis]RZU76808.1 hypothetical protein EV384_5498 [Micromonospora kangleipakensis]
MPIDGRRVGRRSGRGVRYAALAACAPLLVAVLTACGPGQSETTGEADSGTAGLWDAYDKQKQNLATCLNEKGLTEVRYLGHDNLMMEFSGWPDTLTPDLDECFEKWPALDPPVKDTPRKPTEEQLRAGRAIAACMRDNGVPDYPDPDPDPAPIDAATARREKEEIKARMAQPAYKAAMAICNPGASDGPGVG